jgi:ATP synthase proteolipid subunit
LPNGLPPDLFVSLGIIMAAGLSALGASFGIVLAGSAVAGASTERPEVVSKAFISIVLAEAVAIYGLLSSFMLVGKLGTITSEGVAFMALASGAVVGVSCLAAGIGIGYVGSAMTSALAQRPETFSRNVVGLVLAEAIAIYGLLISFMLIGKIA